MRVGVPEGAVVQLRRSTAAASSGSYSKLSIPTSKRKESKPTAGGLPSWDFVDSNDGKPPVAAAAPIRTRFVHPRHLHSTTRLPSPDDATAACQQSQVALEVLSIADAYAVGRGLRYVARFVLQLFPLLLLLGALLAFVDYEEVAMMGGFHKACAPPVCGCADADYCHRQGARGLERRTDVMGSVYITWGDSRSPLLSRYQQGLPEQSVSRV